MNDTMRFACFAILTAAMPAGCREEGDMLRQPSLRPGEPARFFADGTTVRPRIARTVTFTHGHPVGGMPDQMPAPPPLSAELLSRGQERYNMYCALCHGRDGYGDGMIVRRGFPAAASHHDQRLKRVTDEHIFGVITDGLGNMPAYGWMIAPEDRWAIVRYLRVLQFSQDAALAHAGPEAQDALDAVQQEANP